MNLKKILMLLVCLAAVLVCSSQTLLDVPVAKIKLSRVEVIYQKQLKRQIELIEAQQGRTVTREGRVEVLNLMIGEVLINQAAAMENVRISDDELAQNVKKLLEQYNAQGRQVTEAQFKELLVAQQGKSWEEIQKEIRLKLIQEKYLMLKKQSAFTALPEPTEAEVRQAYNTYATQFVNPQMVRFSHIFFDTRNLGEADQVQAKKRAEEVLKEVRAAPAKFKELALKYSDDTTSKYKGGDSGYIPRGSAQVEALLGKDFVNAIFEIRPGQVGAAILRSNIGYHIIMVTELREPKILGLDDPLIPGDTTTVRQQITKAIKAQKQQLALAAALKELIEELKKKAESVQVYAENMNW